MELIELTAENWTRAIELEVHEDQKEFVASNVKTIAQSKFYPEIIVKALGNKKEKIMVGLVAYFPTSELIDEDMKDTAFIMRFMVDKNQQGKGYGRELLDLVIKEIKVAVPNTKKVNLTVLPNNSGAIGFYEKVGFVATGRELFDELEYSLDLE